MEAPAVVDFGPRLMPAVIRHAELSLSWSVLAVLEDWTTPAFYEDRGTPLETRRFRVRVTGPLPGRPSEAGEFGMLLRRFGDREGCWICPEPEDLPRSYTRAAACGRKAYGLYSLSSPSITLTRCRFSSSCQRLPASSVNHATKN